MNEEHREHRRKDDKPWWKDGRFLVPMLFTVTMSLAGGFFGSWVASSNRLAALGEVANGLQSSVQNIQRSVEELRKEVGASSNAITAQSGEIRRLSQEQDSERAFIREQVDYNANVIKFMTEVSTTMRLRGIPLSPVPEPPKLGGQRAEESHK